MDKKLSTFLLVIIAVALLGTIAFFQQKQQLQHTLRAQPVPYAANLDEWQPVTATGTYTPRSDVLIPAQPGYLVLTAFQIEGGPVVLINRGTTTEADYPDAPHDTVTIIAYVRRTQPGMQALAEKYPPETDRIDTQGLAEAFGTNYEMDYLQLKQGQAGALEAVEVPD